MIFIFMTSFGKFEIISKTLFKNTKLAHKLQENICKYMSKRIKTQNI